MEEMFGSFSGGFIIRGTVFLPSRFVSSLSGPGSTGYHFSPLNTISVIDNNRRMNIHITPCGPMLYAYIHFTYSIHIHPYRTRSLVVVGILGHGESSGLRFFSGPGLFSYLLFRRFPSGSINWGVLFLLGMLCD